MNPHSFLRAKSKRRSRSTRYCSRWVLLAMEAMRKAIVDAGGENHRQAIVFPRVHAGSDSLAPTLYTHGTTPAKKLTCRHRQLRQPRREGAQRRLAAQVVRSRHA